MSMVPSAWTYLQVETPTLFSHLFSSHVLLAGYTLLLQTLAFYYVNDVKINTSDHLGSHFLKMAFGPSVWIQIHINIGFTKFGATAFIISFLRLRCGAHLIHQPTADNLVEPTERVLLLSCLHYSNSPFAVQYYRPMLRNVRQSWILHPIPWIVDSKCWIPVFFSGTWILDSIP